MQKAWAEGQPFSGVLRFRKPGGSERILHTQGMTIRNASGIPVRAIGVVQDITEQHLIEEELRRLSLQLMGRKTRRTEFLVGTGFGGTVPESLSSLPAGFLSRQRLPQ